MKGEIRFDGEDALSLTVGERNVGFVFQNYALFRHMTVFENIAFGLRARRRRHRLPEGRHPRRVHKLLDLVQLGSLADRYPNQLSGGQRQRIALARALAIEPRVLLLDEPFGALDARVRKELRRWLRRLHDEIHVTSLFVTHDQEEALEVADRVVVMDNGRIEQVGTPQEVYEHPATPFVHDFIGELIVIPVTIENGAVCFPGSADRPRRARSRARTGKAVRPALSGGARCDRAGAVQGRRAGNSRDRSGPPGGDRVGHRHRARRSSRSIRPASLALAVGQADRPCTAAIPHLPGRLPALTLAARR